MNQSYLKSQLNYDPETGEFVWLKSRKGRNNLSAGWVAKCTTGNTYRRITLDGKKHMAHRLAWLYMTGNLPDLQIDHINGDGTDNRFCNLRLVTNTENSRNRKLNSNNTSGFQGVAWRKDKGKWQAAIKVQGKQIYLGFSKTLEQAVILRKRGEAQYGFHENNGSHRER